MPLPSEDRKSLSPITLGNLAKLTDMSANSWENYIDFPEDPDFLRIIGKQTNIGRPLDKDSFSPLKQKTCVSYSRYAGFVLPENLELQSALCKLDQNGPGNNNHNDRKNE